MFLFLKDYAASTVFLKSKTIELEKDKPIIKAVEAFSKEENEQIDNKIREAKERIKKVIFFEIFFRSLSSTLNHF